MYRREARVYHQSPDPKMPSGKSYMSLRSQKVLDVVRNGLHSLLREVSGSAKGEASEFCRVGRSNGAALSFQGVQLLAASVDAVEQIEDNAQYFLALLLPGRPSQHPHFLR